MAKPEFGKRSGCMYNQFLQFGFFGFQSKRRNLYCGVLLFYME